MAQFNLNQKEITLKIVYYGPALSGKTTNLQMVHQFLDPQSRGRLMNLETADDRTLFFDLLPVFFRSDTGFKIKIKLYTVPGQVMHVATRRILLAGVDGIIFVADAQIAETRANSEAWHGMQENLRVNGLEPDKIPIIIQFNKTDLPNTRTDAELEMMRKSSKEPIFKAVAVRGTGVLESLYALMRLVYRSLQQQHRWGDQLGLTEQDFLRGIFHRVNTDSTSQTAAVGGEKP